MFLRAFLIVWAVDDYSTESKTHPNGWDTTLKPHSWDDYVTV